MKPFMDNASIGTTEESNLYLSVLELDPQYDHLLDRVSGSFNLTDDYNFDSYCYADCAPKNTDCENRLFNDVTDSSSGLDVNVVTEPDGLEGNDIKLFNRLRMSGQSSFFQKFETGIPPKQVITKLEPLQQTNDIKANISKQLAAVDFGLDEPTCSLKNSNGPNAVCKGYNEPFNDELYSALYLPQDTLSQDNEIDMASEGPAHSTTPLSPCYLLFNDFDIWANQAIPEGTSFDACKIEIPVPPQPVVPKALDLKSVFVNSSILAEPNYSLGLEQHIDKQIAGTTSYESVNDNQDLDYTSEMGERLDKFCLEIKDKKILEYHNEEYFCECCNKLYINEQCPVHLLQHVMDSDIDMDSENPAQTTVPDCLKLSQSGLKVAGVWATEPIPKGTCFGPCEGVRTSAKSGNSWAVEKPSCGIEYIDSSDTRGSNWMRYVKFSPQMSQVNLMAFQWEGEIDIPEHTEQFVWSDDAASVKQLNSTSEAAELTPMVSTNIGKENVGVVCDESVPPMVFSNKYLKHKQSGQHGAANATFKCDYPDCYRVFNQYSNLVGHTKIHTRRFPCSVEHCGYFAPSAYSLKKHMLIHTGEKPFKCSFDGCSAAFSQNSNLKLHITTHHVRGTSTTVFKCECPDCDKVFSKYSSLSAHKNVHTRKYSCSVEHCDYCAPSAFVLKMHMLKHTGEKPFTCSFEGCSEAFTQNSNLKLHIAAIHLRIRNFVCAECAEKFQQKNHLIAHHRRKHTAEKPFQCPHCVEKFRRRNHLKEHLRLQHRKRRTLRSR